MGSAAGKRARGGAECAGRGRKLLEGSGKGFASRS